MTEYRDPAEAQNAGHRESGPPGTPRWVLALGVVAVALIVIFIVAQVLFGIQHGPGMHGATGENGETTPTTSGINDDVGAPAEAHEAGRTVEVTAFDTMAFEPAAVEISPDEIVTFVVTNSGHTAHEFTLGDAAMQQEHADAMEHMQGEMPHDLPNSIRLEPGETKELTWRFGDAGMLEYACHEPGHHDAGMRGSIAVS